MKEKNMHRPGFETAPIHNYIYKSSALAVTLALLALK